MKKPYLGCIRPSPTLPQIIKLLNALRTIMEVV